LTARRAIGSAILAAAGIAVLILARRGPEDPPSSAVRDWARIASGRLHLEMRSTSPAAVSRFFLERGLPFRVDPETLALPGFRLSGARVHVMAGRPSALVVHRDPRNRIVVCQRFEGRLEELPSPDRVFLRDPAKVHLYRSSRGSAVFWQDGSVTRSLASDVSEEELVSLALNGKLGSGR
jgi:hypothetical protein